MGLTKINKILKKYKRLHKKSKEEFHQNMQKIETLSNSHKLECDKAILRGSNLFDEMIKELEGQEIFPKNKG